MYVPEYFRPPDEDVVALLRSPGAVDLITVTARGLLATMLPMAWDEPGSRSGIGDHGALLGHVAIKNDQWREPAIGEALAIVRGPDAYITPSWYAAKREHGRVVPTWNYTLIHAYGRLVVHEDAAWLEANVRRLVEAHEAARPEPWAVDDAPRHYIDGSSRRSSASSCSSTGSRRRPSSARPAPTPTSTARSPASRRTASAASPRRCAGPARADPGGFARGAGVAAPPASRPHRLIDLIDRCPVGQA